VDWWAIAAYAIEALAVIGAVVGFVLVFRENRRDEMGRAKAAVGGVLAGVYYAFATAFAAFAAVLVVALVLGVGKRIIEGDADESTAGSAPQGLSSSGGDVDCAGGSGDGPRYVQGPVPVPPSDPNDLDRDGDGIGCD
jgi:hypothetical protein